MVALLVRDRFDGAARIGLGAWMATMDRLSLVDLAHLFEFLTAADVARLSRTCRALQPSEPAVQAALGLVVKHRFGDVVGFLREDDPHWPRSPLILRCAEVLRVKAVLNSAVHSPDDASPVTSRTAVLVSKAWTLAWKKRCASYEQYLQQFRVTKKKQLQRERSLEKRRNVKRQSGYDADVTVRFSDPEASVTKEASALIVCPHDKLLPVAFCISRSRRAVVTRNGFRLLSLYAPDVRGFAVYSTPDCMDCIQEKAESDREDDRRKQERFEESIAGSTELVDVLLRKNGYPNELFSPATSRGNTMLSLHHTTHHHSFYLVPKKWLIKWRKYARSLSDDVPGPIFNSELVCDNHQRTIVPAYITMFLSGFSLEVSLQATQALGASASTQYEIVTDSEWEALVSRHCAEYSVGFDVHSGSYHWKTPECHVCQYGMGGGNRREGRNSSRR